MYFLTLRIWLFQVPCINGGFPRWCSGKAACQARDAGSIPGSGRSPGGGHGSPLQYSCLENPMGRGAWWATVHGVTESQTWLRDQAAQAVGSSYKWNQTVFVYTYCMLACIFRVNFIYGETSHLEIINHRTWGWGKTNEKAFRFKEDTDSLPNSSERNLKRSEWSKFQAWIPYYM